MNPSRLLQYAIVFAPIAACHSILGIEETVAVEPTPSGGTTGWSSNGGRGDLSGGSADVAGATSDGGSSGRASLDPTSGGRASGGQRAMGGDATRGGNGIAVTSAGGTGGSPEDRGGASGEAGVGGSSGVGASSSAGGASAGADPGAGGGGATEGGASNGEGGFGGDGSAGAGGSSETRSPSALPGLVLWLDAMQGVETSTDGVASWTDLSVHRHVARQYEIARRPALVPTAFGEFSGIRFDGVNDRLIIADHPSLQMGTDSFFLGIVLINTSQNCCQQIIFSKQIPEYPFTGVGVFVNWWLAPGDFSALPPSGEFAAEMTWERYAATPLSDADDYRDGGARLVSLVRTPVEFSIRVNGATLDSTSPVGPDGQMDLSAMGMDLTLGNHTVDARLEFEGAIAEIVYVRGASPGEVVDMERYLRGKYADVLVE